jgi:membrane associated rhomboid family serine protease
VTAMADRVRKSAYLGSAWIKVVLYHFPYATVAFVLTVVLFALAEPWIPLGWPDILGNCYTRTLNGEIWRLFTTWIPHAGVEHVVLDVTYLVIVGTIVELRYGLYRCVVVFGGANVAGAALAALLDLKMGCTIGSSDGSHALLAYLCVRELASGQHRFASVFFFWGTILYLVYLTVCGVVTGYMGWPFSHIPNGGYDHMGGLSFALLFGAMEILFAERRGVSDLHEQKSKIA